MLFFHICLILFKLHVRDADLAKKIGAVTALEVRASGIHYTFAPCVAVSYYGYNHIIIHSVLHFLFTVMIALMMMIY